MPSAASRSPRLAALRLALDAQDLDGLVDVAAGLLRGRFLQSIIPAPVRSRSALTSCADMAVLTVSAPLGGASSGSGARGARAAAAGAAGGLRAACRSAARLRPRRRRAAGLPRPRGGAPLLGLLALRAPPRPRGWARSSASRRSFSSASRAGLLLLGAEARGGPRPTTSPIACVITRARADRVVVAGDHVVDRRRGRSWCRRGR